MNLDPKANRARIKQMLADMGIDYEKKALENKEELLKFKAQQLAAEVGLRLVKVEPCKWN